MEYYIGFALIAGAIVVAVFFGNGGGPKFRTPEPVLPIKAEPALDSTANPAETDRRHQLNRLIDLETLMGEFRVPPNLQRQVLVGIIGEILPASKPDASQEK